MKQSRRDFLANASLAAAAGVLGPLRALADEAPPETTTIRLGTLRSLCLAPQYAAEEMLHAEGFTDVHYVPAEAAERLVDGGFTPRYDYALQTLVEVPYGSGGNTTRRTRSVSTRFGSTRRA